MTPFGKTIFKGQPKKRFSNENKLTGTVSLHCDLCVTRGCIHTGHRGITLQFRLILIDLLVERGIITVCVKTTFKYFI